MGVALLRKGDVMGDVRSTTHQDGCKSNANSIHYDSRYGRVTIWVPQRVIIAKESSVEHRDLEPRETEQQDWDQNCGTKIVIFIGLRLSDIVH